MRGMRGSKTNRGGGREGHRRDRNTGEDASACGSSVRSASE